MKLVLYILVLSSAFAMTPEELTKKYLAAVLRVEVLQKDQLMSYGTAFYISDEGHILINYHTAAAAFKDGHQLRFVSQAGKVIDNYQYGKCLNDRNLDICILKLETKPKVWLNAATAPPSASAKVYALGATSPYKFSLQAGKVENVINKTQLQVKLELTAGHSGAPLLGSNGDLLGMVNWINQELELNETYRAMTHQELSTYHELVSDFKAADKMTVSSLQSDLKAFAKNFKYNSLPLTSEFSPYPLTISIPSDFNPDLCQQVQKNDQGQLTCRLNNGESYIQLSSVTSNQSREGTKKRILEEFRREPIQAIKPIIKSGKFRQLRQKFTKTEINQLFYSRVRPWQCDSVTSKVSKILNGAEVCLSIVNNVHSQDAIQYRTLIFPKDFKGHLLLDLWFKDSHLEEHYSALNEFIKNSIIKKSTAMENKKKAQPLNSKGKPNNVEVQPFIRPLADIQDLCRDEYAKKECLDNIKTYCQNNEIPKCQHLKKWYFIEYKKIKSRQKR